MTLGEAIKISAYSLENEGIPGLKNLILAYLNLQIEPLRMSSRPLMVQIEPTLHCNLKCDMCVNPLTEREKRHMRLDEFKEIFYRIPFIRKISLVGAGEPLLNPDIFNMISYANSKDILVGFATNGMLLNPENCQKIIDSGAHWVNISIDSADKERFEAIRKGANLKVILEGTKRLLQTKGKRNLPEISLWFVLMKDNLTELPKVINLAKDIGVNKVFAQLEHHWNNTRLKENIVSRNSEDFLQKLIATFKNAKIAAKKAGVYFNYVNVPNTRGKRSCKWPWQSCYISVEGFITPCCLQGWSPEVINFGNILKEDFKDIWNSLSYRNFRKVLKSKTPPKICIDCPSYYRKLET